MPTLRVHEVLHDRVLVSRESARRLEGCLRAMTATSPPASPPPEAAPLVIDFEGVEGIAPSFLDELLLIFDSVVGAGAGTRERRLVVANPPTRLSLKFQAIARGHGMSVQALPDGSWLLVGSANKGP